MKILSVFELYAHSLVVYASRLDFSLAFKSSKIHKTKYSMDSRYVMPGLHQITKIGNTEITDEYEPLEEGLDKVTDTRSLTCQGSETNNWPIGWKILRERNMGLSNVNTRGY